MILSEQTEGKRREGERRKEGSGGGRGGRAGKRRGGEGLLAILVQTVTLTEEENKMTAFFSTLWSQATYLNVHIWERKKHKHIAYNTSFWVLHQAIWGHVEPERKS